MSESDFQVTQKQAADYLNVSTKTISRYRKKGLPYKMILNPVTGKQEVRFKHQDLERWHEGRSLLATYGQDGNAGGQGTPATPASGGIVSTEQPATSDYLAELLEVYKDQIQLLKEQLEDMRVQLARRDRQIDDLMRLMVGFQLEYKPEVAAEHGSMGSKSNLTSGSGEKKVFSKKELADNILRLRQRGKSYTEIARGLNHINVATLSGQPAWTEAEVQSLLPALVDNDTNVIEL
ncbi:MAG: hypothetical protein CSA26_10120 [Desulfobacterales bacterium]|nr:MAG: hypothetical protein CSA26_10120 [Desulfobacterales bacterium]